MTPEEILRKKFPSEQASQFIPYIEAMKEYARQERDKALDWAAAQCDIHDNNWMPDVDQKTILSGKTHTDLHI